MDEPSPALTRLFKDGRQFNYQRGDTIIRAGDIPSGVYFIVSGWVKVYSLCDDGESNIIMSLRRGEVFPLAWAVTGISRDVNFCALEATSVLRLPREQFIQAMQADRTVSRTILLALARCFFSLSDELENLNYHSARERVIFRLVCLADCFGQLSGGRITINHHIPNEYIARSTNMTRETASREIGRLTQKKLILNVNGRIVIPDLAALKNEAGKNFSLPSAGF